MLALAAVLNLAAMAGAQEHVIVRFDDASLGPGVHAGNIFLADGVRITSCTAPDAVAVGANITLASMETWFEIWQYGWAVSLPNYAVPLNAGTADMLLSFTVPVTSVSMNLDFYPNEAVDTDRLLVLKSVGSNTFTVQKILEFTDENGVPPATHISIDLGGDSFSYVLFQTLTELEGFDDLEFFTTGPIPAAADEGPLGPIPAGSGGWASGGSSGGGGTDLPTTNDNTSGVTNDNKSTDSPSTEQPSSNDNSAINDNHSADVNGNSSDNQQSGGSGGSCGTPVGIIMLCGMLLLRLFSHNGSTPDQS